MKKIKVLCTHCGKTRSYTQEELDDYSTACKFCKKESGGFNLKPKYDKGGGVEHNYEIRWFDDEEIVYEDDGEVVETFTSKNPNLEGVSWEDREIKGGIVKGNKRYNDYFDDVKIHLEDSEYVFLKKNYSKGGQIKSGDKFEDIDWGGYIVLLEEKENGSWTANRMKNGKVTYQLDVNKWQLDNFYKKVKSHAEGGLVKKSDYTMLGAGLLIGGLFAFLKK